MATRPQPTNSNEQILTDIIGKLKTMTPYLARSADRLQQSRVHKLRKDVDELYSSWLRERDDEVKPPVLPFEEEWVDEMVRVALIVKRGVVY